VNRWAWGESRPEGPRRGRWTQAEIAHLKDWYGLRDVESLARDLARKPGSVRRQAALLFRTAARTGPWTAHDVAELKRYLGLATPDVIASVLGRDLAEVRTQIFELGRVKRGGAWTHEEKQRLKRLYGRRSDDDLALIFARSVESIRSVARTLHLAKDKAFLKRNRPTEITRMPRWSLEQLDLLRQRYPTEANLTLAKSLGKSVKSIVSKAHHLGLKKEAERLRAMGRENIRLRYARRS
jgi:hypothetical protein